MKPCASLFVAALLAAQTGGTGTQRMAARLAQIFKDQDWKTDPNKAAARVAYYRQMLLRTLD